MTQNISRFLVVSVPALTPVHSPHQLTYRRSTELRAAITRRVKNLTRRRWPHSTPNTDPQ